MSEDYVSVLLVDDSAVLRRLAASTLSALGGYQVEEACDAFDAMRLMHDKDYDVMIVDYYMPGLDGIELVKRVRKSPAGERMVIVMATSEHDPFVEEAARQAGVEGFVVKPLEPSKLASLLDSLVARNSAWRPARMDAQTLLDGMPFPAMVIDQHHNVILANQSFWEQTGAGIDDSGVRCCTYMHPDGEIPSSCPLIRCLTSGEPIEDRVADAEKELQVSVYPLHPRGGSSEQLFLHLARPLS